LANALLRVWHSGHSILHCNMRTLKELFDVFAGLAARPDAATTQHTLQLATAVLLVEVMRADPHIDPAEQASVVATLREKFALDDEEGARLVGLAGHTATDANDFYRFTSSMNDHFLHSEKIQVIEKMWEVAYADAHLGAHENHVISKVAGLLHVTHGEYIAAKLRAKSKANSDSS
jgi:uncharacterized tellurite resistance protein B-like protein